MGKIILLNKVSWVAVVSALAELRVAVEAKDGLRLKHRKDIAAKEAAIGKAYGFMGRLRFRNELPD
jgi:hypothetical protein